MIDPEVEWHANFAELSEDDLASLLETKVALNIFIEYLNEKQLDEATTADVLRWSKEIKNGDK